MVNQMDGIGHIQFMSGWIFFTAFDIAYGAANYRIIQMAPHPFQP
jgi:hypothetical protein